MNKMKLQSIHSREAIDYAYTRCLKRGFAPMFSLVVFLVLFGPKFGLVDTIVVGGLIGLLILLPTKSIKIPKYINTLIALMGIIVFYSMSIYILTGSSDNYVILRNLRAFFSTILISIIIYNVPLRKSVILDTIINILLLHALAVLIQVSVPVTKLYFSALYLFDKNLSNPMRAFGLTAGYDIAGYLCIVGMILALLSALYSTKTSRYIPRAIIFGVAAIFTSRVSLVILVVMTLFFGALFIVKGNRKLKVIGIIGIVGIAIISRYYIVPLIMNTAGVSTVYMHKYVSFFAETDIRIMLKSMWIFPTNEWSILFGAGVNPHVDSWIY